MLRGRLVRLRAVLPDDVPTVDAILAEPEVAAWWQRSDWGRVDWEGTVTFAIELDGVVAGCIQYVEENDPDYRNAAVDIFVTSVQQDRGVGSDAMRALIRYLIEVRGHHRILVDPAVANARAIHVYEKLGFRIVGVMRQYERVADGTWRDGLLMELLADDFSA